MKQSHSLAKRPTLQVNVPSTANDTNIDDRWMEFKILGKNLTPRSYHCAAIINQYLYIYGGYDVDKGILGDFWRLRIAEDLKEGFEWQTLNQEKQKNYPGKLKGHSCIAYEDKLIIFGGQEHTNANTNLVRVYDTNKKMWEVVKPNIEMPKLDSHGAILIEDKMYVYGGYLTENAMYSGSIFVLDLLNWKWSVIFEKKNKNLNSPEARGSCGFAYVKNQLWVFGGTNGINTLNDLWKFDLQNKVWTQMKPIGLIPQPRRSMTMVAHQEHLFVFGGIQDVTKQKNDIFIYYPPKNEWYAVHRTTNSVYDISPTLKSKRQDRRKQKSETKKSDRRFSLMHQIENQLNKTNNETDKSEIMKRILEHNRQKRFQQKKNQMLRTFDVQLPQQKKRRMSPTSENMFKTLQIIGTQQQSNHTQQHRQVVYDETGKFLVGKKPCARDAHAGILVAQSDKMLICGGDRHLMCYGDVYLFCLKKGLESKQVYT